MAWDDELEFAEFDMHLPQYGDVRARIKKHPTETLDGIVHSATMNTEGWISVEKRTARTAGWNSDNPEDFQWVTMQVNLSHFAMIVPV